jgi:protease stability complex PrcB-like protein
VLALAGVLLAVRLLPEADGEPVAWRDLSAEVGPLSIAGLERRLFRDQEQLDGYLARAQARQTPTVDFSKRQLLLVSTGPRSSTGYSIEVLDVEERDGEITVRIREVAPKLNGRVEARVTYPYRLLSLPAGRDVYVDWLGR